MSKAKKVAGKPAKAIKPVEVEEEVEETEEEVEEETTDEELEESTGKPAKADKDSVDVIAKKGRVYVRSYSLKVHGKDYKKMAEGLIVHYPKRDYSVVPSSQVKAVDVRYREKEDFEKSIDEQKPDSPMVDKSRTFTDKEEALKFNIEKKGAVLVNNRSAK